MQDTEFYNCRKGIITVGGAGGPMSNGQGVGSVSLVDVHMYRVPVAVETSLFADNSTALYISNGGFENCANIVVDLHANRVLYPGNAGGKTDVLSWGFGKVAGPTGELGFHDGSDMMAPASYPDTLLVKDAIHPRSKFFHRTRPSYADPGNSQIFDVKAYGAKGDGSTDDTAVLNRILDVAANLSAIVYFPHGVYVIKDTIEVPVGSRIIGQAWPQIVATGSNFQDMANPRAAVRLGSPGSVGVMEIQCIMFTVRGPTAGAVLVEWNVHESSQGSAGLWDSHIRVGGAKGSDLQKADCPKTSQNAGCIAASMMMHMTEKSSGYLENVWMWVADHDMEDADQIQISVYAARGILIESKGPTWLWGTAAEHAALYQYQLSAAKNVVMGLIQTEAPYYQPRPNSPAPFEKGLVFRDDPTFDDCSGKPEKCRMAWSLRIVESTDVFVLSAGLYTLFQDYSQDCVNNGANDCQQSTFYVEQSYNIWMYNLITIGAVQMATPLNGKPIIAKNNRNGFASSIVAWLAGANQTVGDRNITGFTLYARDDLASHSYSEQCKTALTATITRVKEMMQWTSPAYRGSLNNATLQAQACDKGCGASLSSWYKGVADRCVDRAWSSGAPLEMSGGYIWYGYNESCQTDGSGQNCNDVIAKFSDTELLDNMPNGELCSECFSGRVRMMQQSTYSVFNTVPWFQKALAAIQARCKVQGPTDVPSPLIDVPKPKPFCVSNKFYTTKDGDTCNSIAQASSASSASIFYAACSAGASRGCNELPAGLNICLPLPCTTYQLKSADTCFTASAAAGIEDISLYNSWIDDGCDNLQEANSTMGSVLCASPLGGTYIPGAATNTSQIPGSGPANYSTVAVDLPAGATVAPGTPLDCGRWYVAQKGDTCAFVTSQNAISLVRFALSNPSINAFVNGDCSASIVAGYAYCVSLVFNPRYRASTRTYSTKLLGCWSNSDKTSRPLLGSLSTSSNMTLDFCGKSCWADGYSLAGLNGTDACLCGDEISFNSQLVSTAACAANQKQAASVYSLADDVVVSFQFRDVGCFPNNALLTVDATSITWDTNNTVRNCASFCLPKYAYFGVANGKTCQCGTGMDKGVASVDTDANCNVVCTGRPGTNCGGAAAMHIYSSQADPFKRPILNTVAYYDDFSQDMAQWTSSDGTFTVDTGALLAASSEGGISLLRTSYSDFTYEVDISFPSTNAGDAGIIFRVRNLETGPDMYQGYYAGFGTSGNIYLGRISNGWNGLGSSTTVVQTGRPHHLKVRAIEAVIDVFVDDMSQPKLSVTDGTYLSGMDGVRVFRTDAIFDNVQLLPLQFSENFSQRNMDSWSIYDGTFDASSGIAIAQLSDSDSGKALVDNYLFTDFSFEADITITDNGGDAGLIFRVSSPQPGVNSFNGYYAGFTNSFITVGRVDSDWNELAWQYITGFDANKTYRLKVQAKGATISVFLDDMVVPKLKVDDSTYRTGMNGIRTHQTLATFDNVEIYTM